MGDWQTDGPRPAQGVVVAVFGASGGVGRTTVAANLSVALAKGGGRVSALDGSWPAPALAEHLGLRAYAPDRWGALARGEPPAAVLVPGGLEGVRVLPAPSLAEREPLGPFTPDRVGRFIRQLRSEDDFILLDTPSDPLDPLTMLAMEEADVLVFVTDASPASLRRLSLALNGPWAATKEGAAKALVATRLRPDLGRDAQMILREVRVPPHLGLQDNAGLYWPSAGGAPVALSDSPEGAAWRRFTQSLYQAGKGATKVGSW